VNVDIVLNTFYLRVQRKSDSRLSGNFLIADQILESDIVSAITNKDIALDHPPFPIETRDQFEKNFH
jgi:hypothetical protein